MTVGTNGSEAIILLLGNVRRDEAAKPDETTWQSYWDLQLLMMRPVFLRRTWCLCLATSQLSLPTLIYQLEYATNPCSCWQSSFRHTHMEILPIHCVPLK